jgi:hypothetical protein
MRDDILQLQPRAQFCRQGRGRVASNGKSTALFWAIRRKRGNDCAAAHLEGPIQMGQIAPSIDGLDEEVKHGAVVPDVHRFERPVAGHIRLYPDRHRSVGTKAASRPVEGLPRDIEHSEAIKSASRQGIDEM